MDLSEGSERGLGGRNVRKGFPMGEIEGLRARAVVDHHLDCALPALAVGVTVALDVIPKGRCKEGSINLPAAKVVG